MKPFVYQGLPSRVVFGAGSLEQLPQAIEAMGAQRALVLCTPEQRAGAERVAALLGDRAAGIFDRAVMHVPIETAREAREVARQLGADCAVAIGGGSTTGLGKAIALDSGLPILAIPTTYAGSEMTPIYGITEAGLKKTGKDLRVLPKSVLYDPLLTLSLPVGLSVTSGINAIAHAAEGLYSVEGNPVIDLMAEEGIGAIGRALTKIVANPQDVEARSDALYGAWLCGIVLGSTCRTPKPTPSCCRTHWPTTLRLHRRPCSASPAPWVAATAMRPGPCSTWPRPVARQWPCATSV